MAGRLVKGVNVRELAVHLGRHPRDVPVVARAAWRLRRNAWWRHAPYLPLPSAAYWEFRMVTATGGANATMSARAIVEAARWAGRQPGAR
jgi:hypothetical protein